MHGHVHGDIRRGEANRVRLVWSNRYSINADSVPSSHALQ